MSEVKTDKISSVSTNGDITLDPDGTGAVVVDAPIKLDGNYPTNTGNVALGDTALDSLGTGNYNTAVGHNALTSNTDGSNTALGAYSLARVTTGGNNVAVGREALEDNTGDNNTAVGYRALTANTTTAKSTAVGSGAAVTATTAAATTAIGYNAGNSLTTANNNTFIGAEAGTNATGAANTFVGRNDNGFGAGHNVTTGAKNVILGGYDGNQGSLDIRTSSNYVVLSDGDGNPRLYLNGEFLFCDGVYNGTTGSAANVRVETTGQIRRSTSSLRYKNTVTDASHGLTELLQLRPVTFKGNDNDTKVVGGLIAEEVHDAGLTEFVDYDDQDRPDALAYGNMVSLCIKAIQELKTELDAEKTKTATLQTQVADLITRVTALEDA